MSSSITLNSNIASLNTQRRLLDSTKKLQQSFSHLSSGLRINRASDDAAGLSISEMLGLDARVFTQGVRNVNDAVSLLNIAEGAGRELSSILMRQRELAEQAANGTLSRSQRIALNAEANQLAEEFNRIVESTDFNGVKLIDSSLSELKIQGGYGTNGSISFGLGEELERTVGTGEFEGAGTFSVGTSTDDIALGDFNNDGNLDLLTVNFNEVSIGINLGNGDGTFQDRTSFATGASLYRIITGDFNADGNLDIATDENGVSIRLGNGDGTFGVKTSYAAGGWTSGLLAADVNGDSMLDIVTAEYGSNVINVFIGKGDGTLGAAVSYSAGVKPVGLAVGDFNGDGHADIVTSNVTTNGLSIIAGTGGGAFASPSSYDLGYDAYDCIVSGDFNGDGFLDLATASYADSTVGILIGNGGGGFAAPVSYQVGDGPSALVAGDFTGDGILDLATNANYSNEINVLIGESDGTFGAAVSYAAAQHVEDIRIGDLNNDGALDFVSSRFSETTASVLLGKTTEVTSIARLDLTTREQALSAMETIDDGLLRVSAELAAIGAVQSRLSTAVSNLEQSSESYLAAKSRITDIDVAEEAALLVKNQILQQAGAAILGQANQAPALALVLLDSSKR